MLESRFSLPLQMALAIFLGICVGLFFGERCSVLQPYANAYVMILKVTAIPYLIVAIIHGIGLLTRAQAMQIVKKGSIFIGMALFIVIGVVYLMNWVFPVAEGIHQSGYVSKDVPTLNFAEMLIPQNIFYSLANNVIPAVVVFCILIGISLIHMADKQTMMSGLKTLLDALTKVTAWIARITPIGTFIILANQTGTVQPTTIKQMGTYVLLYILGSVLVTFWVMPRIASTLTQVRASTWIKNLVPALVLAYTTTLTIVALPYIINIVSRELQILYPKDENIQTQVQGTVSIIFNIPIGSIFLTAFVFFCALFFSVKVALPEQIKLFVTTFLTSLGGVGVGSSINTLTFIFDSLGLPIDAINLYLTIVPFTSGFQSMVSVMIIATLAFLIMLAGRNLLTFNWKKLLFGASFALLPVLLIFGSFKFLDPLPKIKSQTKTIYDLEITADANVKIQTVGSVEAPSDVQAGETTLNRILRTKKIRIGFDSHTAPFCFYNKNHKLVGFDIAYAYQLAYDLGCEQIEFIPIIAGKLGQQIQSGAFDVAMSAISISSERLKEMCFPKPSLETKIVFVTKDKYRKKMINLKNVKSDQSIKVAALISTAYEGIAYEHFPEHEIILLNSYEEFDKDEPPADVLIWNEQEAIAWTVAHPQFEVVYPKPILGEETLGFPIRYGDPEFLCYLNSWVTLKENDGFKQEQYDLWILAKTHTAVPPKARWSILDNIFHWGQD